MKLVRERPHKTFKVVELFVWPVKRKFFSTQLGLETLYLETRAGEMVLEGCSFISFRTKG